jgi:hypothetical protein
MLEMLWQEVTVQLDENFNIENAKLSGCPSLISPQCTVQNVKQQKKKDGVHDCPIRPHVSFELFL